VLLCDVDHGLVHEHDLALSRRAGRLGAVTPDGQRPWNPHPEPQAASASVHHLRSRGTVEDPLHDLVPESAELPAALPSDGERMDLQHAVWALIAHREVVHRRAA
jgi:hypothetical protein